MLCGGGLLLRQGAGKLWGCVSPCGTSRGGGLRRGPRLWGVPASDAGLTDGDPESDSGAIDKGKVEMNTIVIADCDD